MGDNPGGRKTSGFAGNGDAYGGLAGVGELDADGEGFTGQASRQQVPRRHGVVVADARGQLNLSD